MSKKCANYKKCKDIINLYPPNHPDRLKFDVRKCDPVYCKSGIKIITQPKKEST